MGIVCSLGMWADDVVLKTIDFTSNTYSSYRTAGTIATKTSVDDCYYVGGFSITSAGKVTFPSAGNMSNSRYLAVHVTGINGKITIKINNTLANSSKDGTEGTTENGNWKGKYAVVEGATSASSATYPSTTETTSAGTTVTQEYTMSDATKTEAVIFIGRSGSSYTSFGNIEISTPGQTVAHTVTFDANTNGTCSTTSLTEASAGAGVTLPSATANTDYEFKGWATTSTATTADAGVAGDTYKPSKDITLYAVYQSTALGSIKTVDGTTTTWDFTAVTQAQGATLNDWTETSKDKYFSNPAYTVATYVTPSWCEGIAIGAKQSADPDKIRVYYNGQGVCFNGGAGSIKVTIPEGANTVEVYSAQTILSNNGTLTAITGGYTLGDLTAGTEVEFHRNSGATYITKVITKYVAPATKYDITYNTAENGTISGVASAEEGDEVAVTVTPSFGYELATLTAKDADNADVTITDNKFTMPAKAVTVSATFSAKTMLELSSISAATTWDWTKAATATVALPTVSENGWVVLANIDGIANDANFNGQALAAKCATTGSTGYAYRSTSYKCFQGKDLKFKTTVPGTVVINGCNPTSNSTITVSYRNAASGNYTDLTTITAPEKTASDITDMPAFNVNAGDVEIHINSNCRIYKLTFIPYVVTSKITTAKYGTFSAAYATTIPTGVTAYSTSKKDNSTVQLTAITDGIIPASTGVIIYSETAGEYKFAKAESDGSATSILTPVLTETSIGTDDYVLGSKDDVVGFYKLESGKKVGANKAYLKASEMSGAKFVGFSFDDDVTGINNVNATANANNAVRYNLAGQRVSANTKGIVIMNGKKYLNK